MAQTTPAARPAGNPWLTPDWLSLFAALTLALLVRAGLLPSIPW